MKKTQKIVFLSILLVLSITIFIMLALNFAKTKDNREVDSSTTVTTKIYSTTKKIANGTTVKGTTKKVVNQAKSNNDIASIFDSQNKSIASIIARYKKGDLSESQKKALEEYLRKRYLKDPRITK